MKKIILGCVLSVLSLQAIAATELNDTLIRVINQINATLPLLDEARDEINPKHRIQLHVDAFEGADGKSHPGVRDDLLHIRNALIDYINKPAIEPKKITPLADDYL